MKNVYQIREVSVLSFNERVLQEAEDKRNPLMERLKFLGIFSSNMDEFFKVRVAGVTRRMDLGKKSIGAILDVISKKSRELDERFRQTYQDTMNELGQEGLRLLTDQELAGQAPDLIEWVKDYFQDNVLPSLVPIILHKTGRFPQLTDGALYFAVLMKGDKARHALLEIPAVLPRFVQLPNNAIMYLDDVIRYFLNEVFYIFNYTHIEAFEFKISRDADMDIEDTDLSEGYLRKMEKGLQKRKGGRPTRLVYDAEMARPLLQMLCKELKVGKNDAVIGGGRYHNMRDLMRFPVKRPDLAYQKIEPAPHPVLDGARRVPMFDILRQRDILITYPYQSFDHVVRLLREAAIDPKVKEIKMTLYRAAHGSQVVNALFNAAWNGKKVFVSIELQARFDEEHNIKISEKLSEAGARVVYGVPPMKVHSKLILITRDDIRIAGLSTGNFNETTGRLYVDSALLTADPHLTAEVADVFEFLEDASRMRLLRPLKFKHLLVSPFNSRKTLVKQIAREADKAKEGYIFIKANHLTDETLIQKLYEAADAGVHIDLVVRTTYSMLPHPNIHAVSILDRYLEHQRVFIFGQEPDRRVFMSSADLMNRNLDGRIEVGFPVYDPALAREVADIMTQQLADNQKARMLDAKQSNQYVLDGKGDRRVQIDTHQYFLDLAKHSKA